MKISLKAARVNAGFTQKTAAKAIGVTKDTIGNWERGKSFPDIDKLELIEEIYKICYNQIIFLPNYNA